MKYRKLRIAWSMASGIAAVLLLALWVRSYRSCDILCWGGLPLLKSTHVLASNFGTCGITNEFTSNPEDAGRWLLTIAAYKIPPSSREHSFGGASYSTGQLWVAFIPYWIPTIFLAFVSAIPWRSQIRWRFSLRTLLIATTLVAVGLGLVVCAATTYPIR